MVAGDVISIGGVSYKLHIHSNRNKRELVRLGVDCNQKR